jgi:hypothetical protein
VGLIGVTAGSVAGLLALEKKSSVNQECPGNACTPSGKDAADSMKAYGAMSTVAMGVGAAGLIAGAALWLLSPPSNEPSSGARTVLPRLSLEGRQGTFVGLSGVF